MPRGRLIPRRPIPYAPPGNRGLIFSCRPGCGACCVALSISTPIPPSPGFAGLPDGKPSGMPCPYLEADMRCAIYGRADRPAACAGLKPLPEMCGSSREEALAYLFRLEEETRPR